MNIAARIPSEPGWRVAWWEEVDDPQEGVVVRLHASGRSAIVRIRCERVDAWALCMGYQVCMGHQECILQPIVKGRIPERKLQVYSPDMIKPTDEVIGQFQAELVKLGLWI